MAWRWLVDKVIYVQFLKSLRGRVSKALNCTEAEVSSLTLAELLNTVFLLHGVYGSIGDFNTTFWGMKKLVGDQIWADPAKQEPEVSQVIQ